MHNCTPRNPQIWNYMTIGVTNTAACFLFYTGSTIITNLYMFVIVNGNLQFLCIKQNNDIVSKKSN